jgi:hypothetical protein
MNYYNPNFYNWSKLSAGDKLAIKTLYSKEIPENNKNQPVNYKETVKNIFGKNGYITAVIIKSKASSTLKINCKNQQHQVRNQLRIQVINQDPLGHPFHPISQKLICKQKTLRS